MKSPTSTPSAAEELEKAVVAFTGKCKAQLDIVRTKYNNPNAFQANTAELWDPLSDAVDITRKRKDVSDQRWSRLKSAAEMALIMWRDAQIGAYTNLGILHATFGFQRFWMMGSPMRVIPDGVLVRLDVHMKSLDESNKNIHNAVLCFSNVYFPTAACVTP